MPGQIRVLVVINVRLFREGLSSLLRQEAGIAVAGTAVDGAGAVSRTLELQPDIVLLDTGLPDCLHVVRSLLAAAPLARVIALSLSETDPTILSFAQAGMAGYVTHDGSFEHLLATIRSAFLGEFLCSPRFAGDLLRRVASAPAPYTRLPDVLTRREHQVVELIAQDFSNKAIAIRLSIEVSTVKNHVHHILDKLQLPHRRHIAARVRRAASHPAI